MSDFEGVAKLFAATQVGAAYQEKFDMLEVEFAQKVAQLRKYPLEVTMNSYDLSLLKEQERAANTASLGMSSSADSSTS